MSQIGDFISSAHSLRQRFLTLLVWFDLANSLATLAHRGQASQAAFRCAVLHRDVEIAMPAMVNSTWQNMQRSFWPLRFRAVGRMLV
jgi:hypothetical protein